MGWKRSLIAASALLSLLSIPSFASEESGTFYVELVGPDELVGEAEDKVYGPIRNNDTLWGIASLNRPSRSISVYQMMYAILQKNPDAFNQGNINSLINGRYLTLPTAEEALLVSHNQAVASLAPKKTKTVTVAKTESTTHVPAKPVVQVKAQPVVNNAADADALAKTQQDLDALREKLEGRIDELAKLKQQDFDVLKQQVDESSQQMVGLAEVNHRMKMRMQELGDELASIRDELNTNRKNQTRILQMLDKPEVEVPTEPVQEPGGDFFSSPVNLALVILLPILLLATIVTLLLRRKSKKELAEQDKEMAESPISLMDDDNDEFSQLFTESIDGEDDLDLNAELEGDPDLSVEAELPPAEPSSLEDEESLDDLQPEEEASFDEFVDDVDLSLEEPAAIELDDSDASGDAIELDESELSALDSLDGFESDDLVPSLDDAPKQDLGSEDILSADDLAAALADIDDGEDLFDVAPAAEVESDDIGDEDISFEDALKQQQEMEAELAEASEEADTDLTDFSNIDLSDDALDAVPSELGPPGEGLEELDELEPAASAESLVDDGLFESVADAEIDSDLSLDEPVVAENVAPSVESTVESDILDNTDTTVELDSDLSLEEPAAVADEIDSSTDDDFAALDADLEQLSSELSEDAIEPSSKSDVDDIFDSFSADAFNEEAPITDAESLPERDELESKEFVDIDALLNDAEDDAAAVSASDPYDEASLDVELNDFPDMLPTEGGVDVDANAELASKLDLARAYLEIDDKDGARKILEEVIEADDGSLKSEAEKLLERFS